MASRIYTQTNKQELLDLAEEMTRMALVATRAAEELGDETHITDGWSNALDGLDSLAKMLGGIVGQYRSPPPQLTGIRKKINDWRAARKAAQDISVDLASTREPGQDSSRPARPGAGDKAPARQPPARGPKPKE